MKTRKLTILALGLALTGCDQADIEELAGRVAPKQEEKEDTARGPGSGPQSRRPRDGPPLDRPSRRQSRHQPVRLVSILDVAERTQQL